MPISDRIHVDFSVDSEVNYSLLHNNRELLTKLTLTKLIDGPLTNIAVEVQLHVGSDSFPIDIHIWCSRRCSWRWHRRSRSL